MTIEKIEAEFIASAGEVREVGMGFVKRALDATPRWLVGLIGTVLGVSIAFTMAINILGIAGPFHSVVDSWAASANKFEASVNRLEAIVDRINKLEDKATTSTVVTAVLEGRVTKLETEMTRLGYAPAPEHRPAADTAKPARKHIKGQAKPEGITTSWPFN